MAMIDTSAWVLPSLYKSIFRSIRNSNSKRLCSNFMTEQNERAEFGKEWVVIVKHVCKIKMQLTHLEENGPYLINFYRAVRVLAGVWDSLVKSCNSEQQQEFG